MLEELARVHTDKLCQAFCAWVKPCMFSKMSAGDPAQPGAGTAARFGAGANAAWPRQ